jgi:hypothetical protein
MDGSGPSLYKRAKAFIEEAEQGLVSFLPHDQPRRILCTGANIRVLHPPHDAEHYELQLMEGPTGLRIEIGFHAEHKSAEANDAAIAVLTAAEKRWRKALGPDAEAGPFLGRPRPWRRLSEVWDDTAGFEDGVAVEAAERLALYIELFEPIRAAARTASRQDG